MLTQQALPRLQCIPGVIRGRCLRQDGPGVAILQEFLEFGCRSQFLSRGLQRFWTRGNGLSGCWAYGKKHRWNDEESRSHSKVHPWPPVRNLLRDLDARNG